MDGVVYFQCGDCLADIEVHRPVPITGSMPCPTDGCEGGVDFAHAFRHSADAWEDWELQHWGVQVP